MSASLSATVHCPSPRYSHSVASRCPLAIEASGLARAGGAVHASVALKAGVAASSAAHAHEICAASPHDMRIYKCASNFR